MKKTGLWYFGLVLLIVFLLLFAFPNILGWNTAEVWLLGCPISQIALLALPTGTLVSLWVMYMGDRQTIKRKLLADKAAAAGKGGEQ